MLATVEVELVPPPELEVDVVDEVFAPSIGPHAVKDIALVSKIEVK